MIPTTNTTPDARFGHVIAEETVQTVLLIIVSVVGTWLCLFRVPWQVSGDPCLVAAAATGGHRGLPVANVVAGIACSEF
jgi:hypothetical protein